MASVTVEPLARGLQRVVAISGVRRRPGDLGSNAAGGGLPVGHAWPWNSARCTMTASTALADAAAGAGP
jgi:hypothetical protein